MSHRADAETVELVSKPCQARGLAANGAPHGLLADKRVSRETALRRAAAGAPGARFLRAGVEGRPVSAYACDGETSPEPARHRRAGRGGRGHPLSVLKPVREANERASEPTRAEWGSWGPASEREGESEGRSPSE